MINYTPRLDRAIKTAAWAHEQQGQHCKGGDTPYIIHPFGVMTIAGIATNDEDTLIACLLHDVLEDVEAAIYNADQMEKDFGPRVLAIVKDVTKNDDIDNWHERGRAYLNHLEFSACDEAVIVSASDKIHNLLSVITDYETLGDELWQRFTTKSAADQLWWYESVFSIIQRRDAPQALREKYEGELKTLRQITEGRETI